MDPLGETLDGAGLLEIGTRMPMKVFSSMTQEKLVLPRFSFSSVGKPSRRVSSRFVPWARPVRVVPVIQAMARATMVFLVAKDSTIARIAGITEMNPGLPILP